MIDPVFGIDGKERKQWLSKNERAAIKAFRPYQGMSAWLARQIRLRQLYRSRRPSL
jgi:hypothetical protein